MIEVVKTNKCECGEVIVIVAVAGPNSDKCLECSGTSFSNRVTDMVTNFKTPAEA